MRHAAPMAAALWVLLAGCGYHSAVLQAPFGARRVVVWPVEETGLSGLGPALTRQLRLQLQQAGLQVVGEAFAAQAELRGQVTVHAYPGTSLQAVQVYNLDATAKLSLVGRGQQVLWQETVGARESFLPQRGSAVADQPLATETQRRYALDRLAEHLAQAAVFALQAAQAQHPSAPAPHAAPAVDRTR